MLLWIGDIFLHRVQTVNPITLLFTYYSDKPCIPSVFEVAQTIQNNNNQMLFPAQTFQ